MQSYEEKMKFLIEKLLHSDLDEEEQSQIHEEISLISPDPYWSDLIFWTDDYCDKDSNIDFDKFFNKINDYPNSEHGLKRSKIKKLLLNLLNQNFIEMSEVSIIDELNSLIDDIDWTQKVFVSNEYKKGNGDFNYENFLNHHISSPHEIHQFY